MSRRVRGRVPRKDEAGAVPTLAGLRSSRRAYEVAAVYLRDGLRSLSPRQWARARREIDRETEVPALAAALATGVLEHPGDDDERASLRTAAASLAAALASAASVALEVRSRCLVAVRRCLKASEPDACPPSPVGARAPGGRGARHHGTASRVAA